MNSGLTENAVAQIHAFFSRHPQVEKAVLYGSRAKGNFKEGSDIDLALFGVDLTPEILGHIQGELDDGPLPHRFDLSLFTQITHTELIEHIHRVGMVFYEKKPVAAKD
jgi:uncharacterized protein